MGMAAIEFRNLATGKVEASLPAQNWGVSGMAFSPDGTLLATSSGDGTVSLWDAADKHLIDTMRGHLLGVHGVGFSPDGDRLATLSHKHEAVKLWDVATHQEVATLAARGPLFHQVRFSPDGRLIVAINAEQTAYVWRAPSPETIEAIAASNIPSTR
jgi:WD40 repeat protein